MWKRYGITSKSIGKEAAAEDVGGKREDTLLWKSRVLKE